MTDLGVRLFSRRLALAARRGRNSQAGTPALPGAARWVFHCVMATENPL